MRGLITALAATGLRIAEAQFSQYDRDGDGIPDWWERTQFGGTGVAGPNTDKDGDGASDADEFHAGTDPNNPKSVFKVVTVLAGDSGQLLLSWSSVVGKIYSIEKATDLGEGFYDLVTGIAGTPPVNTYTDVNSAAYGHVFYRIGCR